jgi:hypothetical protein
VGRNVPASFMLLSQPAGSEESRGMSPRITRFWVSYIPNQVFRGNLVEFSL